MALKATICRMDYSTKAIYTSLQQKSPETRAFTHTLKKIPYPAQTLDMFL